MWIIKGVLLGLLLFIVGGISYVGIRTAIALHRLAQQLKAGTAVHSGGAQWDIRALFYSPIFWTVFLAAIALGLLIVRARMHNPPTILVAPFDLIGARTHELWDNWPGTS
jgi:hypothetical protein